MAGQKTEREHRYETTGWSPAARRERVRQMMNAGWSERQIARAFGVAPSTANWWCAELKGHPRQSVSLGMCESCWDDWPKTQLDRDGLCPQCAQP